jgi:hypothetical protein
MQVLQAHPMVMPSSMIGNIEVLAGKCIEYRRFEM